MSRIQDLSEFDKPREKAMRFGIETLSDEELLALIINSGNVGYSALDIARALLDDCHYLEGLLYKPKQYFQGFKGLKEAKSIKLMAALEMARRINEKQHLINEEKMVISSESLYRRYSLSLGHLKQEVLAIVILNKNKQIVYEKVLYRGDDSNITVNYRYIIQLLAIHNAYYFYLIHNHPNNTSYPSEFDIDFTEKMIKKAEAVNAELVDHLIISQRGYYSFLHQKVFSLETKKQK